MQQKITLQAWADLHYSPAPTSFVLGNWRRANQIHPPPERVGRAWYVEPDAQRVTFDVPRPSLVTRLKNAA
jgi:hypothetical protein